MKLLLERFACKQSYTVGRLYIDGTFYCHTMEDTDRGLDQSMSVETIKKLKIAGITAIPTGTYDITMDVVSPKFKNRAQYAFCGGKLPRLVNVKGYDGILIHIGNTHEDSAGCILVGQNTAVGKVLNSTVTFNNLYKAMEAAHKRGEKITIEIKK